MDDLTAVLTAVGAVLAAVGGTWLTVREFRRRDHVAASDEIHLLGEDLHECRERLVEVERHLFRTRAKLAQHGIDVPDEDEAS